MIKIRGVVSALLPLMFATAHSAELVHSFNSPAFNGMGFSSHILTLKQLEDQRTDKNKAAAEAIRVRAEYEAANTPEARFIANIESRVYSQLAKQLTDSLFGSNGMPMCTAATAGEVCGIIPDLAGNMVTWKLGATGSADANMIVITITSNTNSAQTTTMKIPSGTFYFGGTGGP
jgi:hypothetical protein